MPSFWHHGYCDSSPPSLRCLWRVSSKGWLPFPNVAVWLSAYLSFYSYSNPPAALYLQGEWFQGVIQEPAAVRLAAVFSVHCGTCGKKVTRPGVNEGK